MIIGIIFPPSILLLDLRDDVVHHTSEPGGDEKDKDDDTKSCKVIVTHTHLSVSGGATGLRSYGLHIQRESRPFRLYDWVLVLLDHNQQNRETH